MKQVNRNKTSQRLVFNKEKNAVDTLRALDAPMRNTVLCTGVRVYIFLPCQCFNISPKHYKEFCDGFGLSANALTMNLGLPEAREWMKRWLHLYYLLTSFLLYVCVGIFYDLQTIRSQCFGGGKNSVGNSILSVTHLLLDILSSANFSEILLQEILLQKKPQAKSMWALIHTHTLNDNSPPGWISWKLSCARHFSLLWSWNLWEMCLIIIKKDLNGPKQ